MNLHVRVKANSKVNQITRDGAGNWVIKIKSPPVDGKANAEVILFLSKILRVPKSKISIAGGLISPQKRIMIKEIAEEEVWKLLELKSRN